MKFKKLLSVILALAMLTFCCIPSFATTETPETNIAQIGTTKYASLEAAVEAAQKDDTVTLLNDVTYGTDHVVAVWEKEFDLDLNGHTFTTNSNQSITLGNNGYKATAICYGDYAVVNPHRTISVSNGTIRTAYGAGIYADGDVVVTLSGLDVKQNYPANVQATDEYSAAVRTTTNATVIIEDGIYKGKNAIAVSNSGGSVTINDGTFEGNIFFSNGTDNGAVKSVTINGGSFTGEFVNPGKGTLTISGGTFSADPSAYVASGCEAVQTGENEWQVVNNNVAQVGETKYLSLAEAVAAAQPGDTVKILKDSTLTSAVTINKNLTIDFNGCTLTASNFSVLKVNSNYALTVTDSVGNGGITLTSSGWGNRACIETDGNAQLTIAGGVYSSAVTGGNYCYGIWVRGNSSVVVTGGEVLIPASSTATYNYAISNSGTGNVTISGGRVTARSVGGNYTVANSSSGNVYVTGGYVTATVGTSGWGYSPYAIYNTGSGTAYISGGYISASGDKNVALVGHPVDGKAVVTGGCFGKSYYYTPSGIASGYFFDTNTDADTKTDYPKTVKKAIAQVGATKYSTLAAAIAAANNSENATVTLLTDYDMESNEPGYGWTTSYVAAGETTPRNNMIVVSGTGLTLDLNGHTLSNLYNNTFKVTGENVTIENGTMTIGTLYAGSYSKGKVTLYGTPRSCSYVVLTNGAQNFTINNLTTTGGINVSDGTTATINGLNFSGASYYAICSQEHSNVTINGGTFDKATAGYANYLLWVDSETDSVMTINGGTFLKGSAKFLVENDGEPVIYGGIFDLDVNAYTAPGYEAVKTGETEWTVGEVKASNLAEAQETTEGFDATYSVTKRIIDKNNNDAVIGTGTAREVNVKVVTEDVASVNTANEIIGNLSMDKVLDGVVAAVADANDTISVEIQVASDDTNVDDVNNTITYEVHPEATIYVNDQPAGTVTISNDALAEDAVFTIKLAVPDNIAAASSNGNIKVVHVSEDYGTETSIYPLQGELGNYYIQFDVTHFSEFIIEANGNLFTGHSVKLNGYINLNFYLDLSESQVTTGTGTVVDFTWANGANSYKIEAADFVSGKGYKATVLVPAAEMSYAIHATVKINGVLQSESDDYSVRQYALELLDSSSDANLINLVNAMLDYGAKAQVVFGRTDVALANSGIGYTMPNVSRSELLSQIDAAISTANNGNHANNMVSVADQLGASGYYSSSLVFLSGCTLRHYFYGFGLDSSKFTGVKYTQSANYYYVDMPDIAAADLDTLQEFHVGDVTFYYSALDYVKAIIYNYAEGESAYNLAAATYFYNQAANAYFVANN